MINYFTGAAQSLSLQRWPGLGRAGNAGILSLSHPIVPVLPGRERNSRLRSICIVCEEGNELKAELCLWLFMFRLSQIS